MTEPYAIRILAAPLIWLVLLVAMYVIQGAVCGYELAGNIDRINSVRLAILALALIGGAWIAKLSWDAAKRRRGIRRTIVGAEQLALRRQREMLELVTLLLGVLSLVGVAWLALGVFMYPLCEGG